ncbi:uncharacterized protein [Henckelia pumila]|uniref:uncharacterized protein n=1 Tax=Henckelia pumila TaxID=405737 RepID=UPI003C6DEA1B
MDTETLVVSSQVSTHQYQAFGGQHEFSGKTSTMVAAAGLTNTLKIVDTNNINQSKVLLRGTVRHHLTEAEKEARRLRRVQANRESARQTIRRRQAMYLELTGKAANLSMENTYLKQERDLAVKKYYYLKDKNQFLKAQMAKRKLAKAGHIRDKPESSLTEISSSSAAITTPICLNNRASLLPFFWPFNSQRPSDTDFTNASQIRIPMWNESCLSQGQDCSTAINKPRPPYFILPVPWLLPFISPDGKLEFHPATKDQQHEPPPIHQCQMCSSFSTLLHEDRGIGVYNPARVIPTSNGVGARFRFPRDYTRHGFSDKNHGGRIISSSRKPGNDAIAATEARRKRRELMMMRSIHSPDAHIQ